MAGSALVIYREHVKPPLARRGYVMQKVVRHQGQISLLRPIHGRFGGLNRVRSSRLHFYKTKNVPLPPDQIQFTAMLRRAVIARNDGVAAPP